MEENNFTDHIICSQCDTCHTPPDSLSLCELRLCRPPTSFSHHDKCGDRARKQVFDSPRVATLVVRLPVLYIQSVQNPEKYVGYADLPNQIFRYCAMTGFDFNLLIVGESGLGKSTFINNMFCVDVYTPAKYCEKTPPIASQTIEIRASTVTITENGIPMRLTMIDTPGFGDYVNNSNCWEKILQSIDKRNEEFLAWENSSRRSPIKDMRVHCCIYFISPTGHRLKPLDIDLLQRLHEKVNIVPVIARADSLTPEDLIQFKKRIIEDFKVSGIKTYDFPDIILRDIEERDIVENYLNKFPFAIVSSNMTVEVNGKVIRCRKFPWGICEIENPNHSDFIPLRNLLLRTCTSHLIETTNWIFYERFRARQLGTTKFGENYEEGNHVEMIDIERNKHQKLVEKTKSDLELKLREKEEELKQKLAEKSRLNTAKIIIEEENLHKLSLHPSSDTVSHSDVSKLSKESATSEDLKKNSRKKKLF